MSKNVNHHGWLTMKNTLKQLSKKQQLNENIYDSKFSYLEFVFWKNYIGHTKFLYLSICSCEYHQSFYFNFRFSSRKFQSWQKLAKKITHFTIQFCSKYLTHFANLNSLDIENNMLPQTQPKTFLTTNFQQTCFCTVSEKIFVLHHFLAPKNCILQAHWKQMSAYFYISP